MAGGACFWARPDRKRVNFDPDKARKLLAEDGWSQRDSAGYLTRADGTRFPTIKLLMPSPSWARIHGVIQEDLWKEAGIKLETQQILYSAFLKKVWEQKFQLVYFSWTAGLFPDMKMQFFSEFADQMQSNNLNGFKDKRADEIMVAYQTEFDAKKRKAMIHELDQILFDAHPYALGWYAPYFRVIYWDKFGYPPEYVSRYGDSSNVIAYWWFNEKRQMKMENDRTEGRSRTPSQSDIVDQFWWLKNPDPRPRSKGANR